MSTIDDRTALDQIHRWLTTGQVPADAAAVRVWVQARRRAAQVLLFHADGVDEGQRRMWKVGYEDHPIRFAARTAAVGWLHWLASNPARGLPVAHVTEAASGAEAARRLLKNSVDEISKHCVALAVQLSTFKIEKGFICYRPRPHFLTVKTASTTRVGNGLVSLEV